MGPKARKVYPLFTNSSYHYRGPAIDATPNLTHGKNVTILASSDTSGRPAEAMLLGFIVNTTHGNKLEVTCKET